MALPMLYKDPVPVLITGGSAAPVTGVIAPKAVVLAATDQKLADANTSRQRATVSFDGSGKAFLRFGGAAATIAAGGFHIPLVAGEKYDLPPQMTLEVHVIGGALSSGIVTLTEWV